MFIYLLYTIYPGVIYDKKRVYLVIFYNIAHVVFAHTIQLSTSDGSLRWEVAYHFESR